MGQFDLETDAALAQINFQELSTTPGGEFAEIIGDLLKVIGGAGPLGLAGGVSSLLLKIRKLAGASYASNLIYTISAVRNDLATLCDRYESLRGRIEALPCDAAFAEAISALALRAMHTSVKNRLARLARIVANGVKEDDLEPESLDDMMRAAVELKEFDLRVLQKIYEGQAGLAKSYRSLSGEWAQQVAHSWAGSFGFLDSETWKGARSALAHLQSFGFIHEVTTNVVATGELRTQPFGLLPEGAKFYERILEIGKTS